MTTTAEIVVTFPDEATLIRAVLAAAAVAPDAALYRSTSEPWQLKACQGQTPAADWRGRLICLVEVLLPEVDAPPPSGPSLVFGEPDDASFDEYQRRQAQGKGGSDA